jgi:RNA polymerase sigma-70 factor (ECF subfamily)
MTEVINQPVSVQHCRAGDQNAIADMYTQYVQRLVRVAQRRLSRKLTARVDAEDIVQSAFRSFFGRLKEGRYDISNSDDLWNLLSRITLNKTFKQIDFHGRLCRDSGKEVSLEQVSRQQILNLLATEPTPEQTAMFLDELEFFLAELDSVDRQIVALRLEGLNNVEIARKLRISDRKIRRFNERMRDLADMDRLMF